MLYTWKDKNTDFEITVVRPMDEYTREPDKDEAVEKGMDVEDFAEAEWERVIASPLIHRTPDWGSKGNM